MGFKMKGHSLPGIKQRVGASPMKQNVDKDGLYVKPDPDKKPDRPSPPKPRVEPNTTPPPSPRYNPDKRSKKDSKGPGSKDKVKKFGEIGYKGSPAKQKTYDDYKKEGEERNNKWNTDYIPKKMTKEETEAFKVKKKTTKPTDPAKHRDQAVKASPAKSHGKMKLRSSGPLKLMGSFIDGERVTYEEARKREKDPKNKSQVVHTNDEAQKAAYEDTQEAINKGEQKAKITGQDGKEYTNPGLDLRKEQKLIFDKTKDSNEINEDRAAQQRLERAAKQKANKELYNKTKGKEGKGPKVAGYVDDDGYPIGSDHAAYVRNRSKLKLDATGNTKGVEAQYSKTGEKDGTGHNKILGFDEAQKNKKDRERAEKMKKRK